MEREILFRGKRMDNGEWVVGALAKFMGMDCKVYTDIIQETDGVNYMQDTYKVDPATVGQYTGMTFDGKKVFEGDIIKTKKYGKICERVNINDFDIFAVVYEPCMFRLVNKNRGFNLVDNKYNDFELIGNIHDNPELLEVQG